MRHLFTILLVLLVGIAVYFITRAIHGTDPPVERVTSTVLLERISPVLKLVTVEGEFSELYTYRDAIAYFQWMERFSPFQKQAILRVKARASVGYDLEGMSIRLEDADRTVHLLDLGTPQLLSLEHEVDYFDLEEGTFNRFSAADHERMNAEAKALVRRQIEHSGLYAAAEAQRNELIALLRAVVENSGWRLDVGGTARPPADRMPG